MLTVHGRIIPNLLEPSDTPTKKADFLYAVSTARNRVVLAKRYEISEDSNIDGWVPSYDDVGLDELLLDADYTFYSVGDVVFATETDGIVSARDSKYAFRVISEEEYNEIKRKQAAVKDVFDALNLTDEQLVALHEMIYDHLYRKRR